MLSEKIAQVSYQALCLIPATISDAPDGKYDWRSSSLFILLAKVPGILVQPVCQGYSGPSWEPAD